MKVGDVVSATWGDGLTEVGTFSEKKQGYVILLDDENKRIVCDPSHVTFKILQEKSEEVVENRAKE